MTNAELAILSLIAEQARHGYQIEQVIEARGMREWTEVGFSSIYYLLKRLEGYGWIVISKKKMVGQGAPRKVYAITAEGQRSFEQAILEALATSEHDLSNFQLGLANINHLPKPKTLEALQAHVHALEAMREHVRMRRETQAPLPLHVDAMFELSLTMIEARLDWMRTFIQRWEQDDGKS
jgi:DNA-binding PadR family transcriptional regulator